jgi:hypothetical protein
MKGRSLINLMVCLTILGGSESFPSQAQNRQVCKRGAFVDPAIESKKIRNPIFGLLFDIPANYTSETSRSDNITHILLYNPNEQELNSCCKKNRQIGCDGYPSLVSVRIEQAKPDTRLLPELYPDERLENIKPKTIANQKAVVYVKISTANGVNTFLTASFMSPNTKYKITVVAFSYTEKINPIDERVFQRVISSFAFVK